ncbi:MAG: NAD(+) diphosphatase [Firmicutes bacterium]|nr:NAD(+) diphosphatase [Bacillota bacterium]
MIQDIFPHHLYNQYDPSAEPVLTSRIVVYQDGRILLHVDQERGTFDFPRWHEMGCPEQMTYLFSLDETKYFLAMPDPGKGFSSLPRELVIGEDCDFYNLREIRRWGLRPRESVFAAFTALQLAEWYERTVFCGKCGHVMHNSEKERARVCPLCGTTIYPRINPAVIVGVKNGDSLLITRYKGPRSMNALVAGFTEIGETFEETVAREVMEETGVRVKNIRYYKSQPWGIASDILAGFYCEVDGDPTIRIDESELKYAEWVRREEIGLQPQDYSLTNEMMQRFKEGKE